VGDERSGASPESRRNLAGWLSPGKVALDFGLWLRGSVVGVALVCPVARLGWLLGERRGHGVSAAAVAGESIWQELSAASMRWDWW
jgi:hypothetical protein